MNFGAVIFKGGSDLSMSALSRTMRAAPREIDDLVKSVLPSRSPAVSFIAAHADDAPLAQFPREADLGLDELGNVPRGGTGGSRLGESGSSIDDLGGGVPSRGWDEYGGGGGDVTSDGIVLN
jgi:hypothetical protein